LEIKIALVAYKTPGIELALALNQEISKFEKVPNIIFLQNHGLIATSDKYEDIKFLTDLIVDKIEQYLQVDMKKYKFTNSITKLFKQFDQDDNNISYLCNDKDLQLFCKQQKELFLQKPFCPDSLVYCGISGITLDSLEDVDSIRTYLEKYYEFPKIILFSEYIFLHAKSIKKAKEIEDVLKFHILVLSQNFKETNYLEFEELAYLSNWEAEKYRQNV